jgi:hypothetical protein
MGKKDFDWPELGLLNKKHRDWLRSFNYFERGDNHVCPASLAEK